MLLRHRPSLTNTARREGKGGAAAERSEGTLDPAEHRGQIEGRWRGVPFVVRGQTGCRHG
jgi:hypothetical protein